MYDVPGVKVEPSIRLSGWEIFRITYNKGEHKGKTEDRLIGSAHGTWRASSAIKEQKGNAVVTKSGRKYTLVGAPGCKGEAKAVLSQLTRAGKVQIVTKEYF